MTGGTAISARLDGAYVPAWVPGVVAVDTEGEAVLVDEVANNLHLLNTSGALLWACFDAESSVSDIAFDVADALDVPFEQVLRDALAVVGDLASRGLCYDARGDAPTHRPNPTERFATPRRLLEEPPSG
jgi:hypothetical protein